MSLCNDDDLDLDFELRSHMNSIGYRKIKELETRIALLEEVVKELKECAEFYGDPLNYNLGSPVLGYERPVKDTEKAEWVDPDSDLIHSGNVGGKLARATLKKVEEMLNPGGKK